MDAEHLVEQLLKSPRHYEVETTDGDPDHCTTFEIERVIIDPMEKRIVLIMGKELHTHEVTSHSEPAPMKSQDRVQNEDVDK